VGEGALRSLPATVALTVLTCVTAATMGALFRDGSWVGRVVGAALVCHAVLWAARRWRMAQPAAALTAVVAVFLFACWALFPHTTLLGLPTGRTFSSVGGAFHDTRRAFSALVPPVPSLPGFVLSAMAGVTIVAVLSDWAAFRLQAPLEAVVPALATLIFVALLARDSNGLGWVAGFVLTTGCFLLLHRAGQDRGGPRFAGRAFPLVTRGGLVLTAVAVLASVAVGPHLPGARSPGLVNVHGGAAGGESRRTTISPLVDIRTRLVQESNLQLFTVRAGSAQYWRLTALDHFDGDIWSSDESYSNIRGALPVAVPPTGTSTVAQAYSVSGLGSIWLPAAYLPVSETGAPAASWDARSASLISSAPTSDGLAYSVVSAVPAFNAAELRTAELANVDPTYLALPPVPSDVLSLARRITAGLPTAYDKARALQDYLRNHYSYSLSVPPGHSYSALQQFLFVTRRGYCEQFAGSYAVMARAVGLPTRVAVGFTPGTLGSDGLWHVYGLHAHAWPEVQLGRFGWVAFDPTPGRGIPGGTAYTGLPAEQASPTGPGGVAVPAVPAATPTTSATRTPPTTAAPVSPPGAHRAPKAPVRPARPFPWRLVAVLASVAALAAAWLVGVPAAKARRRSRRRRRAADDAARILVAWEEAAERLAAAGWARQPPETYLEHARRAAVGAGLSPPVADSLGALAAQAAGAAYGSNGHRPEDVALACRRALEVEEAVLAGAGRWRRMAWETDPRPIRSAARPSVRGGS